MPHKKTEDLLQTHPHLKEFLPFLDAHNKESTRGAVLIACSYLEELLGDVINAFLLLGSDKEQLLTGFNAPLGTFSARIKAAHCMGLISNNERDDCDTLRRIRNEFAHNHKASIKDQKIVDLCKNLHASAKSYDDVVISAKGQLTTGPLD